MINNSTHKRTNDGQFHMGLETRDKYVIKKM